MTAPPASRCPSLSEFPRLGAEAGRVGPSKPVSLRAKRSNLDTSSVGPRDRHVASLLARTITGGVRRLSLFALVLLVGAGCSGPEETTNRDRLPRRNPTQQPATPATPPPTGTDDGGYQPAPLREGLFTSYADYERQRDASEADLRDAIGTAAARTASACKTVAVGEKACGGPRRYAVYSASGDAELRIIRLAARITALDREANEQFGLSSDCSVVTEPVVSVENGSCVAR